MTNLVIDIALDVLCKKAKPQETLSRKDIAEVCGCSTQYIYLIEQDALKKLKRAAQRISLYDYLDLA